MTEVIPLISNNIDSNCYLVLDETIAIIDTGAGITDWLVKKINGRVPLEDVSLIINTHGHADHCGGNVLFKKAKVMAHSLDAEEMAEGGMYGTIGLRGFEPLRIKVDRKLSDGDTVDLGGMALKVLHTPGHTPGSMCLLEEQQGMLFSGDTLFPGGGFGRVDLGGDAREMVNSLKRLTELDFSLLLPGHGGVAQNGRGQASLAYRYAREFLI